MELSMSDTNENLFDGACKVIPGGVNSPVRALNRLAAPLFLSIALRALFYMVSMGNAILIMWVHGAQ